MTYILVIWTIVAGAGTAYSTNYKYDWRPIGEFQGTASVCHAAAVELAITPDKYRCVRSK